MFLRPLLSVVVLPGVVTIVVPAWIALDAHSTPRLGTTFVALCGQGLGVLLRAIGPYRIPFYEEPRRAQRFVGAYRDYCRHVPRLVPLLRPWQPPDENRGA